MDEHHFAQDAHWVQDNIRPIVGRVSRQFGPKNSLKRKFQIVLKQKLQELLTPSQEVQSREIESQWSPQLHPLVNLLRWRLAPIQSMKELAEQRLSWR